MKNKIQKILEKILLFLVIFLMTSVLVNHYIKTAQEVYNPFLRKVQIILVGLSMALTLLLAYLDRKKNALVLAAFYLLMAGLFFVFRQGGRL